MNFNLIDLVIGGMMVLTSAMLLSHFKKNPDSPRKFRALALVVMIIGFMVAAWDPVFSLVSQGP